MSWQKAWFDCFRGDGIISWGVKLSINNSVLEYLHSFCKLKHPRAFRACPSTTQHEVRYIGAAIWLGITLNDMITTSKAEIGGALVSGHERGITGPQSWWWTSSITIGSIVTSETDGCLPVGRLQLSNFALHQSSSALLSATVVRGEA